MFQFDESLIEDIPGKLQSNTLAVDNLTVDWLRTRLFDLEVSVKDCQEKQLKLIDQVNGSIVNCLGTGNSPGSGSVNNSSGILPSNLNQVNGNGNINSNGINSKEHQR